MPSLTLRQILHFTMTPLALLEGIFRHTPCKTKAMVTKIEVIYTGEIEQMPVNVQTLAIESDKHYTITIEKGLDVVSGQVNIGHMVDETRLGRDMTVIKCILLKNSVWGRVINLLSLINQGYTCPCVE